MKSFLVTDTNCQINSTEACVEKSLYINVANNNVEIVYFEQIDLNNSLSKISIEIDQLIEFCSYFKFKNVTEFLNNIKDNDSMLYYECENLIRVYRSCSLLIIFGYTKLLKSFLFGRFKLILVDIVFNFERNFEGNKVPRFYIIAKIVDC